MDSTELVNEIWRFWMECRWVTSCFSLFERFRLFPFGGEVENEFHIASRRLVLLYRFYTYIFNGKAIEHLVEMFEPSLKLLFASWHQAATVITKRVVRCPRSWVWKASQNCQWHLRFSWVLQFHANIAFGGPSLSVSAPHPKDVWTEKSVNGPQLVTWLSECLSAL